MISQKIKTLLWPIVGLDLEPTTPEGEARIEGNLQPTLGYLVGKLGDGSVLIEGTNDGAIKVATTGSGLDTLEVSSGAATDAATDLALTTTYTKLIFTISDYPLQVEFETTEGSYATAIDLSVGEHVRDISGVDLRIQNAETLNTSVYQIEAYS